jgi:hypothetical protein
MLWLKAVFQIRIRIEQHSIYLQDPDSDPDQAEDVFSQKLTNLHAFYPGAAKSFDLY